MSIEITREEKRGTNKFNKEMLWVIKQLMKRGVDPTHDNIFDFCKTHPADLPHISRLRLMGMEDYLRVYLFLYGQMRDQIKKTRRASEDAIDGQVPRILGADGLPVDPEANGG